MRRIFKLAYECLWFIVFSGTLYILLLLHNYGVLFDCSILYQVYLFLKKWKLSSSAISFVLKCQESRYNTDCATLITKLARCDVTFHVHHIAVWNNCILLRNLVNCVIDCSPLLRWRFLFPVGSPAHFFKVTLPVTVIVRMFYRLFASVASRPRIFFSLNDSAVNSDQATGTESIWTNYANRRVTVKLHPPSATLTSDFSSWTRKL